MKRLITIAVAATIAGALSAPAALADAHEAMVSVEHRINGKAAGAKLLGDPKALGKEATVDVYVNDGLFLDNFEFGDVAGPVPLPPGTYNIKVEVNDTGIFIIDQDVTVEGGDNVRLVARFGAGGAPTLGIRPA
ncbi:MAG: DUF4397 domain-containing protein [Acidimicrobiia bacterium]|nr:DUF4397 domain-containing protein [Acidimicrobiia bacterium]